MNKERLLTTEEKGNEIIEMCKEHGMTDLVLVKIIMLEQSDI